MDCFFAELHVVPIVSVLKGWSVAAVNSTRSTLIAALKTINALHLGAVGCVIAVHHTIGHTEVRRNRDLFVTDTFCPLVSFVAENLPARGPAISDQVVRLAMDYVCNSDLHVDFLMSDN